MHHKTFWPIWCCLQLQYCCLHFRQTFSIVNLALILSRMRSVATVHCLWQLSIFQPLPAPLTSGVWFSSLGRLLDITFEFAYFPHSGRCQSHSSNSSVRRIFCYKVSQSSCQFKKYGRQELEKEKNKWSNGQASWDQPPLDCGCTKEIPLYNTTFWWFPAHIGLLFVPRECPEICPFWQDFPRNLGEFHMGIEKILIHSIKLLFLSYSCCYLDKPILS